MSTPAPPIEYPENIDAAVLKTAGVVVIGLIMSILDITVVNVSASGSCRDSAAAC